MLRCDRMCKLSGKFLLGKNISTFEEYISLIEGACMYDSRNVDSVLRNESFRALNVSNS